MLYSKILNYEKFQWTLRKDVELTQIEELAHARQLDKETMDNSK